jgi:hypothetical protein
MRKAAYKLFLEILVVPAMIGAGGTFPPQIRPADPSAFVGTWERGGKGVRNLFLALRGASG